MRLVAAYIYIKVDRWKQLISLSKKDNLYKDAMETASQSGDRKLVEELLVYFIEQGNKESFASCLFVCYDLIRPDVALELAWISQWFFSSGSIIWESFITNLYKRMLVIF